MGYVVAEYVCPVHGRFDALVERDANGDSPGDVKCPRIEYQMHGLDVEWTEIRELMREHPGKTWEWIEWPCGELSPWTISAPLGRVKLGEVTQGKTSTAERASWTSTENLADGMSMSDWKKKRAKVWRDHRYGKNVRDGRKGMA